MSKFEQQSEFFNITQQLIKYLTEIGTKKFKGIAASPDNHNFMGEKKYNKFEGKNIDKYVDNYYKSKEEASLQGNPISTQNKNVKTEEIPLDLDFSEENILQAVVYSEIFGKPKAKRRRR